MDVYTSGDRVDLQLNGKIVGTRHVQVADKMQTQFSVPYAPGRLTAVCYRDGMVIARESFETVGNPASMRLVPDRSAISANRLDLSYVIAEILDDNGRFVPDAVVEVSFNVGGDGELAGVGSGNPRNMASWKQPHHHT